MILAVISRLDVAFYKKSTIAMKGFLLLFLVMLALKSYSQTVLQTDGNYSVSYSWSYNCEPQSLSVLIDRGLYDYYGQNRDHLVYNFMTFVFSDYDREAVAGLVDSLDLEKCDILERIRRVAAFVQSIPYSTDFESKGEESYARFPVETLIDGTGDCEDKTILMAAILHELGSDFVLIMFDDHVAVGVNCDGVEAKEAYRHEGKSYFYIETTADNWDIGAIPEQYKDKDAQIIPVATEPMFIVDSVNFESDPTSVFEKAKCKLNLRLRNIGPHCATGLRLHVVMTNEGARKQKVLVDEVFALDDLQEGAERVDKLNFMSYIRESCSLSLELTGDNIADWKEETKLNYYVRSPFGN